VGQVKLNTDKCKVISIHHRRYSNTGVEPHYVMNNISLEEVVEIKDLGVYYDSLLLFGRPYFVKVEPRSSHVVCLSVCRRRRL